MARAYYNEIDSFAAQWLRNLIAAGHIADGDVDQRSIVDVLPGDLSGYTQAHFFAGIGGWSLALRLAGWADDRPVWTGSCPCQPFSVAGKGIGEADPRHVWPIWFRLIREHRPCVVLGEQVAAAIGRGWYDDVADDLEREGYAVAAAVLPAAGVGAPHIRDRLWFVADASASRLPISEQEAVSRKGRREEGRATPECRRWPAEPAVGRVAHGVPGRVGRLRAYGNAIVPQVAAEVIAAFMECEPHG